MINRKLLLTLLLAVTFGLFSCTPEHSKIIVAEYDDAEITMGDFENAYVKNVGSIEKARKDSLEDYKNFLDLLVNYKMKLKDAYVRGLDKDPDLNNEMEQYRKNIAVTWFLDKNLVEKGIKDLYEKRKNELRVSHIMIKTDTLSDEEAKRRAEEVIARIKKGEKFEDLVKEYSDDKYSVNQGGDVYYFVAGEILADFEDAAYATPVDSIYPEPVKTRFGYHIIKVTDRKPYRPQIRAKHILLAFKDKNGKMRNKDSLLTLIEDIRKRIANGEKFADLAKKYSDDTMSKPLGGDLGYFERRKFVKPFDEAAFNLKKGEVSGVVKTRYGYHLIKLVDEVPYPQFFRVKSSLKNIYKRTRYKRDLDKLVNKLAKQYNLQTVESTVNYILSMADTLKFPEYFDSQLREKVKDKVLFTFAGNKVICDTVFNRLKEDKSYNNWKINKRFLDAAIKKVSKDLMLEERVKNLENEDPEFAKLMDDYREGLYIFELQKKEVWDKLKIDSTDIYNYYQNHKDKYFTTEKVDFSEIFSRNDSLINLYYDKLKSGADFDSLAEKVTERVGYKRKKGHFGEMEIMKNELAMKAASLEKPGEFTRPFKYGNGWSIVKLNKHEKPRQKTFEEAKAEAASDFQDMESKRLENEYIEKLKAIYHPVYYYDRLKDAFKSQTK